MKPVITDAIIQPHHIEQIFNKFFVIDSITRSVSRFNLEFNPWASSYRIINAISKTILFETKDQASVLTKWNNKNY